ncbi:MAG: polyketide cyclase [Ignavibacteria bacterium GWC2_56_12]|nr:MAG: polyketide cyclase [Ignavibacteria bacterium GWC2_56_12]
MKQVHSHEPSQKDAAVSFLQFVVQGNIREAYAKFVDPDMHHHNPAFAGDAASLEKAMEQNHAQFPPKLLDVKRVLEDGNLVAVHSLIRLQSGTPGVAAVHIFRFHAGRIVELWDVGQPVPETSPNVNGMF